MKKEFITTWSKKVERVDYTPDMPNPFYNVSKANYEIPRELESILPDDIRYLSLLPFIGMKTKVTIEVIPW